MEDDRERLCNIVGRVRKVVGQWEDRPNVNERGASHVVVGRVPSRDGTGADHTGSWRSS